jgi:hypothetical protein
VSTELPGTPGSPDSTLGPLFSALTAGPTEDELAGERAALAMFRANRPTTPVPAVRPSRPPRSVAWRLRLGVAAAAALAAAGTVSAAYAAALPSPVQHIAYQVLGFAGVPDAKPHPPSPLPARSRPPGSSPTAGPASSAAHRRSPKGSPSTGSPGVHPSPKHSRSVSPSPVPSPSPTPSASASGPAQDQLSIVAAQSQIPAGTTAVLSGQVTQAGHAAAGIVVTLLERVAGRTARPGWHPVGTATTSPTGAAVVDVSALVRNAAFRFTDSSGESSATVQVSVVPVVALRIVPRPHIRRDAVVVTSRYAQPGNLAVLQVQSGSEWTTIRVRRLSARGRTVFLIRIRRLEGQTVRIVLPATRRHAESVSLTAIAPVP